MTRIPIEPRDADGNMEIKHKIDPAIHNASPIYRAQMREILYRRGRRLQSLPFTHCEIGAFETSSKDAYGPKSLENVRELRLNNLKIAAYGTSSHFSLENGFSKFESTTKGDYPKHIITAPLRGVAEQHQKYPPVFVDENLRSSAKSLYKSTFKHSEIKPSAKSSLKQNSRSHFELGADGADFRPNKPEPDIQATSSFLDLQKERDDIQKLNSKSYVFNCPDAEPLNFQSTNMLDFTDTSVIDGRSIRVDPDSFAENSKRSNFSFGDSSLANCHSEYISSFDSDNLRNSRPAKSQRSDIAQSHFKDEISNDTYTPKSQFTTDFVVHANQRCAVSAGELNQAANHKSSIMFGEDFSGPISVTKSTYTPKVGTLQIFKPSSTYNDLTSMSSALPQKLIFKPESTTRATYKEPALKVIDVNLVKKEEQSSYSLFDGPDERFPTKPAVDIDFSESVHRYRDIKIQRYAEGSFKQTNKKTLQCTNKLDSMTSSQSYGMLAREGHRQMPVKHHDNGNLLEKDESLASEINLSRTSYVLPEIMKTRDGINYTEILAKEKSRRIQAKY